MHAKHRMLSAEPRVQAFQRAGAQGSKFRHHVQVSCPACGGHMRSRAALQHHGPVTASLDRRTALGLALLCLPAAAHADSKLPIEEVQRRLNKNFQEDQYYVSGKLDPSIFADNCVFTDPTVTSRGRVSHGKAVASLFSPETARADLITSKVTGPQTIEITWRLEGVIKQANIPLTMKPYTGSTVVTTDETGKIYKHDESWDTGAVDVFLSIFIKEFGVPPAPPADELRRRAGADAVSIGA